MFNEEGNELTFNTRYQGSSFVELLHSDFQPLLPDLSDVKYREQANTLHLPVGTTILALCYRDGVIIAGDRRAVEGHRIASRRIEKVYKTDQFSAMAVAGVAGLCIDMAKLFRTELEHYEKIEGEQLVLDGKANKLAHMIKQNFPAALQGLVVVPIFVGYDVQRQTGRIFKYDVVGGMYEEDEFYATGSGGKDARNTIKKLYSPDMDEEKALHVTIEALYDAAEEDAATGGPDALRNIYPNAKTVTAQGVQDVSPDRLEALFRVLLDTQFGTHSMTSRLLEKE
jgi:proteasome beta subunit